MEDLISSSHILLSAHFSKMKLSYFAYRVNLKTTDQKQLFSIITILFFVGEYDAMAVAQGLITSEAPRVEAKLVKKSKKRSKVASLDKVEKEKKEGLLVDEDTDAAANMNWDLPAISLPNGCNSLPIDLIPLLDRFETIYLWLDNDKSGNEEALHPT